MYKLFLTFRYLTRKKIVLFPILVVWLCVMMLIIVTSIMGGFVERVRAANRELFGDIIVSSGGSTRGFSHYEQLSAALKKQFPEVSVCTPTVQVYALIYVKEYRETRGVQLVGVDPAERARVSKFQETLFLQHKAPMEAVDDLAPRLPASKEQLVEYAHQRAQAANEAERRAWEAKEAFELESLQAGGRRVRPGYAWLWGLLPAGAVVGLLVWRARRNGRGSGYVLAAGAGLVLLLVVGAGVMWPVWFPETFSMFEDRRRTARLEFFNASRTFNYAQRLPEGQYGDRESLVKALVPAKPTFDVPGEAQLIRAANEGPEAAVSPDGCVVGSQVGFNPRDTRGNFLHTITPEYYGVTLTVFPANQKSGRIAASMENAVSRNFTIVDDSHTGVYDVDAFNVYAPLELVQQMAGMRLSEADRQAGAEEFAPLVHELLIKLKGTWSGSDMRQIRERIGDFVHEFYNTPEMADAARPARVQTWDEKQARYLGAVQNEKVMMTFILGLMSMVVLVVIFLIFYQIVRDKTRDIGIIKAVGGSEEGVAGIFLTYGLFIGMVGGGLGVLTGALFVTHTNEIHEWIYRSTGIIIWDRSVYLFDRIPDVVNPWDCVIYFAVALGAGVVGALIPAIVAGSQDPVQAVRYE